MLPRLHPCLNSHQSTVVCPYYTLTEIPPLLGVNECKRLITSTASTDCTDCCLVTAVICHLDPSMLQSARMALLPTLEDISRYTVLMRQLPDLFWVGITVLLGIVAGHHAIERQRGEQAADSEERGWQFSADWSPIRDEDWAQLSQRPDFAALGHLCNRKDFIWGTQHGTVFVMFQHGGRVKLDAATGVPETMIAFKRPADLPTVQSTIAGGGSSNWERFVTDHWVFMRANPPRWLLRGPQAENFVREAYAQLRGI
jgi:hypothetical protein